MKTVEPTASQIQAFAAQTDDTSPFIMLNLLRYREQADYVDGTVCFAGAAQTVVIGPEGEQWDDVFLIQYPSRQAFFDMLSSEQYRAIGYHRTAALDDSRLVAIAPGVMHFKV